MTSPVDRSKGIQISPNTTYFPEGEQVKDDERDPTSGCKKSKTEASESLAKLVAESGFQRNIVALSSSDDSSEGEPFVTEEFEQIFDPTKRPPIQRLKDLVSKRDLKFMTNPVFETTMNFYVQNEFMSSAWKNFFNFLDNSRFLGANESFSQIQGSEAKLQKLQAKVATLIKLIDTIDFSQKTEENRQRFFPLVEGVVVLEKAYKKTWNQVVPDFCRYVIANKAMILNHPIVKTALELEEVVALRKNWAEKEPFDDVLLKELSNKRTLAIEQVFVQNSLTLFDGCKAPIFNCLKEKISNDLVAAAKAKYKDLHKLPTPVAVETNEKSEWIEAFGKNNDSLWWISGGLTLFLSSEAAKNYGISKKRSLQAMAGTSISAKTIETRATEYEFLEIVTNRYSERPRVTSIEDRVLFT